MSTVRLLLFVDENVKRIVDVPWDIDSKGLTGIAASTFGMKPEDTGVKCYDGDFEEWVLIPDNFLPEDKQKLEVIRLNKVMDTSFWVNGIH